MGATKAYQFGAKENRIAKYAKALAHPARIAILNLLVSRQTCVCGDLVDELPLSQSTVSQHLKELKEAGLIKGEIEGAKVCYCIDEKEWIVAKELFDQIFESYRTGSSCC
ncbi:MAG: ArsR/SmtB family transcription factor [Bacteroidia bacterium]